MTTNITGPDLKDIGVFRDKIYYSECLCLPQIYQVFSKLETELKLEDGLRRMLGSKDTLSKCRRASPVSQLLQYNQRLQHSKPPSIHIITLPLKMSVNLCAQEGEEPRDVVLHFDVRFHRDNIISLSRKNGVWIGSGNLDTNYNMFVPGTVFRIIFEVKDTDVVTIYCQGKFHSNFLPKIPLSMARYLVAWADVERVTHCYFHLGVKGGDEVVGGGFVGPPSPRLGVTPVVGGDGKRCPRVHRKSSPGSPQLHSSNESSDEEVKQRPKTEGRADKYFYDALMCQPPETKFGSPESLKYRRDASLARSKPEYSRKYRELSDSEKNDTDISEEVASKNMDSSVAESDDAIAEMGYKKRGRRNKFAPFSQVVNFMGKGAKRN